MYCILEFVLVKNFWNIAEIANLCLVGFFNRIPNFCRLSNNKAILEEEQLLYNLRNATYWPRPSCQKKKGTGINNSCIRSKISGDNIDCRQVELSTNVTLAKGKWVSNYYITPATESSDQLQRTSWNENHVPVEAGPSGPRVSSPGKLEINAAVARRVWGQYVTVLFSLQLTSHR